VWALLPRFCRPFPIAAPKVAVPSLIPIPAVPLTRGVPPALICHFAPFLSYRVTLSFFGVEDHLNDEKFPVRYEDRFPRRCRRVLGVFQGLLSFPLFACSSRTTRSNTASALPLSLDRGTTLTALRVLLFSAESFAPPSFLPLNDGLRTGSVNVDDIVPPVGRATSSPCFFWRSFLQLRPSFLQFISN